MAARERGAALAALVCILLLSAGCAESRAQKKLDTILASQEERPLPEVREELIALQERWPDTKAAATSRREVEWIDDLLSASARGPALRAWDSVRELGQAAERYRIDHNRYPHDAEQLIPRYLSRPVVDPWGQELVYQRTKKGYRVVCFGADGLPGGTGLSTDIVVDSGAQVQVGAALRN